MRMTFTIKPGNKLGKRIARPEKLERQQARRDKAFRRQHA